MATIKGVGVDKGAEPLNDPVTVVVSPLGNEYDADDWSDANNKIALGYSFKEGYPTFPGDEPASKATSKSPGGSPSSSSTKSDDKAVAQG